MCEIADVGIGLGIVAAGYLDLRKRYLPIWLLVLLNTAAIIMCILIRRNSFWSVLGGAGVGVIFFLISKLTKEAVGYGDSWLILSLGIYMGLRKLLGIVFVASFMASLFSLFLCLINGWQRKRSLPYVPFLAIAYGLAVFI